MSSPLNDFFGLLKYFATADHAAKNLEGVKNRKEVGIEGGEVGLSSLVLDLAKDIFVGSREVGHYEIARLDYALVWIYVYEFTSAKGTSRPHHAVTF